MQGTSLLLILILYQCEKKILILLQVGHIGIAAVSLMVCTWNDVIGCDDRFWWLYVAFFVLV